MIRLLSLIVFAIVAAALFVLYSAQTMPDWFQGNSSPQQQAVQQLTQQIDQQGVKQFLDHKFDDMEGGELVLSEAEFNALFQASLKSSRDGRRLLKISDGINAQIAEDGIELGVVLNLQKISQLDARTREKVEKVLNLIPLLDKSRVYLAIKGAPMVSDGNLAVSDDFTVSIGDLPISNKLLADIGLPADRLTSKTWPISLMSVESISTEDGKMTLSVLPRL
jgi:hypothetical protein